MPFAARAASTAPTRDWLITMEGPPDWAITMLTADVAFTSHSHSIVAGGFGVMSHTTRLAPLTFVAIFSATFVTNANGSGTTPAFTNWLVEIARMAIT